MKIGDSAKKGLRSLVVASSLMIIAGNTPVLVLKQPLELAILVTNGTYPCSSHKYWVTL